MGLINSVAQTVCMYPVRVLSPVGAINSHSHVQAAQKIIQQEEAQGETRLLQISLPSLHVFHSDGGILLDLIM